MQDSVARYQGKDVTIEHMEAIMAAFNSRNADRIVSYFADDCTFYMASGPEVAGRTVHGKDKLRKVLADRFVLIPDMRWDPKYDHVYGNHAVSVWTVKGNAKDGTVLDYQGCDLWEFRDGLVLNKDTYWKIVRPD
jgi:ketosteroid isomerase-like protein